MRMKTGVGGLLPREVLSKGMYVDGYHLPARIFIRVIQFSIHNKAEYYPQPFEFSLDREFANGNTTKAGVVLARSAFRPFSPGGASCIGKFMVYSEIPTLLAPAIRAYGM
ncbi:hypothetical protein OCU04_000860 [Sclerotinia nivalis]|uniref:Cytochrome P450 n=1 Tax=Sclerotinia nivalis TaxID=352851 RepID=A0A9X0DNU3_9HELO|nr:hypothetical protein OCU04_000860 [Sclerotinia nivalis]